MSPTMRPTISLWGSIFIPADGSAPGVNSDVPLHEYQGEGLPLIWMPKTLRRTNASGHERGAETLGFFLGGLFSLRSDLQPNLG
jgi:hypothetical protein